MLGELCGPSAQAIGAAQAAMEHKRGRETSRIALAPYSRILDCIRFRVGLPVMLLQLRSVTRGVGEDGLGTPAICACVLFEGFVAQIGTKSESVRTTILAVKNS